MSSIPSIEYFASKWFAIATCCARFDSRRLQLSSGLGVGFLINGGYDIVKVCAKQHVALPILCCPAQFCCCCGLYVADAAPLDRGSKAISRSSMMIEKHWYKYLFWPQSCDGRWFEKNAQPDSKSYPILFFDLTAAWARGGYFENSGFVLLLGLRAAVCHLTTPIPYVDFDSWSRFLFLFTTLHPLPLSLPQSRIYRANERVDQFFSLFRDRHDLGVTIKKRAELFSSSLREFQFGLA